MEYRYPLLCNKNATFICSPCYAAMNIMMQSLFKNVSFLAMLDELFFCFQTEMLQLCSHNVLVCYVFVVFRRGRWRATKITCERRISRVRKSQILCSDRGSKNIDQNWVVVEMMIITTTQKD